MGETEKKFFIYEPKYDSSFLMRKEKFLDGPNPNYSYWVHLKPLEQLVNKFTDQFLSEISPSELVSLMKAKHYFLFNTPDQNPYASHPFVQYHVARAALDELTNVLEQQRVQRRLVTAERMSNLLSVADQYLAVELKVYPGSPLVFNEEGLWNPNSTWMRYPV